MKQGDFPCADCRVGQNPIWYTDNVFWNDVMGKNERGKILCTLCFIMRAEKKYLVKGWRIVPDWNWTKRELQGEKK